MVTVPIFLFYVVILLKKSEILRCAIRVARGNLLRYNNK